MIDKREILETASALGLLPNVVEKDYVLGWMLAGNQCTSRTLRLLGIQGRHLSQEMLFTYRFSEDLDFTLRDESHIDEEFLKYALGEVVAWVAEESGLTMPTDQLSFDIYNNKHGRRSCEGTLCFDIFSPPPGDSEVISQLERLSSIETKIAPRSLRIALGASGRSGLICMVVPRVGGCNRTLPECRSRSTSP